MSTLYNEHVYTNGSCMHVTLSLSLSVCEYVLYLCYLRVLFDMCACACKCVCVLCYFGVNVFVNSNENERYVWCLMNRYVFLLNVNLCAIKCRNAVLFLYLMCQNVPHIHLNDEYMNAIDDLIYFCWVKPCDDDDSVENSCLSISWSVQ